LNDHTFALLKQYQSVQCVSSLLDLFPRLAILSIASETKGPDLAPQKSAPVYAYQRSLEATLFKPVTLDDLQGLTVQSNGGRDEGCICLFGLQLETAWRSGWIKVSHVTHLTICAGAGIVTTEAKNGIVLRGKGVRFEPSNDFRLVIQEPANDQQVRSTLSLVLDFACFAKSGTIDLKCDSLFLEMYNGIVSIIPWPLIPNAHAGNSSWPGEAFPKANCMSPSRTISSRQRSSRGSSRQSQPLIPRIGHTMTLDETTASSAFGGFAPFPPD
jgi:hypothetical protein